MIVTRVFCSKCGSALAHQSPGFGDNQAVREYQLPLISIEAADDIPLHPSHMPSLRSACSIPYAGSYVLVETGNLPDFATIPIVAEVFVKDRWAIIKEIAGTAQNQMNP